MPFSTSLKGALLSKDLLLFGFGKILVSPFHSLMENRTFLILVSVLWMAIFKWERSSVGYQVSGSRLYYLNSHAQILCKLIRYEVMRDLKPLLSKSPQHRKSDYYAVYLLFTKCTESRAVNPSAPGWQSWKSLQGLGQSVLSEEGLTVLCCFWKLQQ